MTDLTRWEPARRLMTIRDMMDGLFEDFFRFPFGNLAYRAEGAFDVAIDVAEDDTSFIVKANVPGMTKDNLEIDLSEDALTIRGKFDEEKNDERRGYRIKERRSGSFTRVLPITAAIDVDRASARVQNGVLEVVIPKAKAGTSSRRLSISDR